MPPKRMPDVRAKDTTYSMCSHNFNEGCMWCENQRGAAFYTWYDATTPYPEWVTRAFIATAAAGSARDVYLDDGVVRRYDPEDGGSNTTYWFYAEGVIHEEG